MKKENIEKLKQLEKNLHIKFANKNLLVTALTHSSFSHSHQIESNERLEFFGDAVLKIIISEYLYFKFPSYQEGNLTKIRAQLVSDKNLADLAKKINLGDYILFSQSELATDGKQKESNLANAFEALLGAYYFDQGLKKAQKFILKLIEIFPLNFNKDNVINDYKSRLQEFLQQKKILLPTYQVIKEEGPDHEKIFHVGLKLELANKILNIKATGPNKKEAEQQVAKKMLAAITK
ncbi:MAG: ribonuclease III [Candidatus Margulisiibacteriota bacterium]|jgi:ribonuclease-3